MSSLPRGSPAESESVFRAADGASAAIEKYAKGAQPNMMKSYWLWFILLTLAALAILYLIKPTWVQNDNASGDVNWWKLLLWAVIFGVLITLLIWLFTRNSA